MYIDGCCWYDCGKSSPAACICVGRGENNESWSWFLGLVRKQVLGLDRQVYMISDRRRGLPNGAKEHLEGYPPLIHMWCSRDFAANIWKKQQSKEVIMRLKSLCKVNEEKKF
jgi:hypothetical protein